MLGLVGEYRFMRPTFYCARCQAGHAPLDCVLGLGAGQLSPGLAQVVCEQAQQDSFAAARASVASSVGVHVATETIRRLAEGLGALIEHEQADRTQWAVPAQAVPTRLVVETDGVHTPLQDGYREMTVGRVAALGPAVRTDAETRRATLVLGPSGFCAGLECSEAFFPRLTREASRAGFTRGVQEVVVIADGARWIWKQARTQFSHPGTAVVEIVDFYHASEQLAEVASAVYGPAPSRPTPGGPNSGTPSCSRARRRCSPLAGPPGPARPVRGSARRRAPQPEEYFTDNADRLDYPRFVARQLPIGSGAVESGCKQLISKRAKGAGMRWTPQGAQAIANLRALHQSGHGRWAMFWASRPLTRLRQLPDATPTPVVDRTVLPDLEAASAPADPTTADGAAPRAARERITSTGKPWGKGKGYWGRPPSVTGAQPEQPQLQNGEALPSEF